MSELSKLTAAFNSDALPGWIISPLRLSDFGIAEERFAKWHIERATKGTRSARQDVAERVVTEAIKRTEAGEFTYGMPGFKARCLSSRGLSLVLWLSLRIKHPDMTPGTAEELRNAATDQAALVDAIMTAAGFSEESQASQATSEEAQDQSAGDQSSPPAASAA